MTTEKRALAFFLVTTSIVGLGALFLTEEGQAYRDKLTNSKTSPAQRSELSTPDTDGVVNDISPHNQTSDFKEDKSR